MQQNKFPELLLWEQHLLIVVPLFYMPDIQRSCRTRPENSSLLSLPLFLQCAPVIQSLHAASNLPESHLQISTSSLAIAHRASKGSKLPVGQGKSQRSKHPGTWFLSVSQCSGGLKDQRPTGRQLGLSHHSTDSQTDQNTGAVCDESATSTWRSILLEWTPATHPPT